MSTKITSATPANPVPAVPPVSTITPDATPGRSTTVHRPASSLRKRSAVPAATRKRDEAHTRETRGLRRADALIASGQLDKAIDQLRKLVHDLPDSTRGYLRMASLLRETRRPGEALAVLRSAVERVPDVPATREVLAEMCLEMGRWEEAIQHSRALLALSPRSLVARDVLSAAYFQSGQLDHALRITDEMIHLDPTDAANHFKRGVLLQQKGYIGGAIAAFSRVLAMDADAEAIEESRAAIEMLDNYQIRQIVSRAVEDFVFRLELMRDPVKAATDRGYALSECGLSALTRIPIDELPPAPYGWRQYVLH